jgi:ABC-type antimicrobial peptide transport system permease subunit
MSKIDGQLSLCGMLFSFISGIIFAWLYGTIQISTWGVVQENLQPNWIFVGLSVSIAVFIVSFIVHALLRASVFMEV